MAAHSDEANRELLYNAHQRISPSSGYVVGAARIPIDTALRFMDAANKAHEEHVREALHPAHPKDTYKR